MKYVYLAGPIKGLSFDSATNWRTNFISYLGHYGITALSPLRSKDYLKSETELKEFYPDHFLSQSKTLFTRDHFDVHRSDLIVVNFLGATKVSIGTVAELGMAYAYNKPVIVIMEEGNVHDHSFVKEIATTVVPKEQNALDLIISFLK